MKLLNQGVKCPMHPTANHKLSECKVFARIINTAADKRASFQKDQQNTQSGQSNS